MANFIIAKDIVSKVKRFNLVGRKIEFKLRPIPEGKNPVEWIRDGVEKIFKYATTGLQATDQVGITFCDDSFKRGPGWINFKLVEEITFDDVWDLIARVYQSNSAGFTTDTFCLGITSVSMPSGRGRGRNYNSFKEECAMRRGIVTINNNDNLCLPRALVVGIAHALNDRQYNKVRCDTGKLQTQRAIELMREAVVSISQEGAGIPELQQFQRHLKNYKITVYKYGSRGREVVFEGPTETVEHKINLLYHEGHFNVITSLTAAFCCTYYCQDCHVPYDRKNKHRCGGTCPCCQQSPKCEKIFAEITCGECNRKFRGQHCFQNHKENNICNEIRQCELCLKTVKSNGQHVCGEAYCKICRIYAQMDHQCFMAIDSGKPKTQDTLFLFFDLETRQEKELEDGSKLHEPNLCVVASRCDRCINELNLYFCQKCGYRLTIFTVDVIKTFMEYVLKMRKSFKSVVCIAHNGRAFDHQFVLKYILNNTNFKPDLIMRGMKIILMSIGNVKFIDSLNYFPMPLSALSKAFDLPSPLRKGYFPHLFNTSENSDYAGPLPSMNYFDPDSMKIAERNKFMIWYEEHKNDNFNMQQEIVAYCTSDVEILTQACIKFRRMFLKECNVCPFTEATTIASACNKVFRRNFLRPNTIGIIPRGGYRWNDNQSFLAIQWLIWEEHKRGICIKNAARGREVVIGGLKVDGFCEETREVFEFHGCFYHGHPKCFPYRRNDPLQECSNETLNTRYESTQAKSERLRRHGYEVTEKWECEFISEQRNNNEIEFLKTHPLLNYAPLNPRDAFYGGRTGATKLYYKCKPDEKIKYIDVCSLYPWVCKYGKFPIGHPEVFVGEDCSKLNINQIDGIIKCTILPPQDLYHPVLPVKMNNKLLFALCRSCAAGNMGEECKHTEEERALTGTWVIEEVRKSIEKGYRLVRVFEIWKYMVERYDKFTHSGGLFTEMMNKFVKIKQQASGWPSRCQTQEEKNRYIEEFFHKEGIQLEFSGIEKNPGLRSLAKLILNSFWGKLGQRENQPKTSIINQPADLYDLLTNPNIIVNHILPINENVVVVNWEHREESYDRLSTVNVCLAAYTTTQARLKLYEFLERLNDRVLYYDTDSVIYISRKGEYEPEIGDGLGQMTDEIEGIFGKGHYVDQFVSGGPKLYAYKVRCSVNDSSKCIIEQESHTVCKVKGININWATSQTVNFDTLKDMICRAEEESPVHIISSRNIRRTQSHDIVTKLETKRFRTTFAKRVRTDNYDSVPFGYKRPRSE